MLFQHNGDTILEWVIVAMLVISVIGLTIYTMATNASTAYGNIQNQIR